jgi:hypothetical protein
MAHPAFQSGLFPGLNFLFTTWYTRKELNSRVSIFFSGATLAGQNPRRLLGKHG